MKAILVLGAILTLFLLAACQQNQAGQRPMEGGPIPNPATSCDADSVCEAHRITTEGTLTAEQGLKVGGPITYNGNTYPALYVYQSEQNGMWYVDHYGKADFFATVAMEGPVGINGGEVRFSANGPGVVILTTDADGKFWVSPSAKLMKIDANLSIVSLANTTGGNAYACVNSAGMLYRSLTPCR
jgi:hypothetical protein